MCPGFDSRTRRHMWVEFVVGSRPSSEGFSPGSPVFLPPQKSAFLNSNSIGNSRATGLSVEDCYMLPSLNKVNLFYLSNHVLCLGQFSTFALYVIIVLTASKPGCLGDIRSLGESRKAEVHSIVHSVQSGKVVVVKAAVNVKAVLGPFCQYLGHVSTSAKSLRWFH